MSNRSKPRTKEAAIREWHRERKLGKTSPKRLEAVRAAVERSECTEPMKPGHWASLAGFEKGSQIKPELKQLVRDGVLIQDMRKSKKAKNQQIVSYRKAEGVA